MAYIRTTTNIIQRGRMAELRQVIAGMAAHREAAGYVEVEWLTSLTGRPDELISIQRYERIADYETSLDQIGGDQVYLGLLARLKDCTEPGEGQIQILRTFS